MTPLDNWYDYVMPYCFGAPDSLVTQGVRKAIDDFLRDTRFLRKTLEPIQLSEDNRSYSLILGDDNEQVLMVDKVWLSDGTVLKPASREVLDRTGFLWEGDTAPTPTRFICSRPDEISIYPALNSQSPDGLEMNVRVAVTVTPEATEVDDSVYNTFKDVIAAGARYHVKSVPGNPCYDLEYALVQKRLFLLGVESAKNRMLRGFTMRPLRVNPVRFGV